VRSGYLEESAAAGDEQGVSCEDCLVAFMFKEIAHGILCVAGCMKTFFSIRLSWDDTSDFNSSDTETLLVFDKVVRHSTVLASVNGQSRIIIKLKLIFQSLVTDTISRLPPAWSP